MVWKRQGALLFPNRPRITVEDPEMSRASCPSRTSLKAAQYTPAKGNQQVIE